MRFFITGATGFIGTELIRFLHNKGFKIRIFCRPSSNTDVFGQIPVEIAYGDIRDLHSIEEGIKECDYIIHLAGYAKNWAKDPQTFYDINLHGLENLLKAARKEGIKKTILTSTCMVFGPSKQTAVNEKANPLGDHLCEYQHSKCEADKLGLSLDQDGIPVVIVHPTRVYGPGLLTEGNSVTLLIKNYIEGKWRFILSDGSAVGNYVFIDDVVQGIWKAFERGNHGEKYILGGENISYNEFYEIIASISHQHLHMIHIPLWLAMAAARFQLFFAKYFGKYPLITPDWIRIFSIDWAFSSDKAQKELGYTITPFKLGIEKTIKWLRSYQKK
ncbi:MAG: NAD-dependent epimerase/dehydratase family protein [Candidatus Aminicenantes bacterium]|nr:NAD-dependent epimerase/dehydratase family protein [Candidatus Aminicenantes bacterium]